jgi:xanthine dehydrogenase accessory factor
MPTGFYAKAARMAAQGMRFAVATVVRVEGSSSAKCGSRALIDAQGRIVWGWVGGGCAETAVRTGALDCMEQGKTLLVTLDMSDELAGVGMPCGGKMEVFIEPVLPNPQILIVGHGRIAETIAQLGTLMNFAIIVNDPSASPEMFPSADRLITNDLDLAETPMTADTYVVIAAQHKGDHLWLQKALEKDVAYVALIASRFRAKLVLEYLLQAGVPSEKVERIWAPAGLDLGALAPEEIALSIVSQIVALRRGGTALPMNQKAAIDAQRSGRSEQQIIRECDL